MTGSSESSRSWNVDFALLLVAQICIHAVMSGSRMASPLLLLDEGYGKAEVGALVALYAFAQMIVVLPAGRYSERHGLKRSIVWSVVVAVGAMALAALFPIYPVLCLAALLAGGAAGSSTIAFQRHATRTATTPDALRKVFAWLTIAPAVANSLGPFAAGVVVDSLGYRAAYVALAALPVITFLLTRRVPLFERRDAASAAHGSAWVLFREPVFRRLILMNWIISAAWDTHGFLVPLIGHERGLTASAIGSILGGFAIAAALVRLAMPAIGRLAREWVLVVVATSIAAVLFWIYPMMTTALAMGLLSAGIGITLGSVQPIVLALMHHTTVPERRGDALAMRLVVVNGSNIATPVLFGVASGALGIAAIFWLIGGVVALGCPLGMRFRALGAGSPKN